MKKIFTSLSLLFLLVAYQNSFAICTVPGTQFGGFNILSTSSGATIDDNTNVYTYNSQNGSNFTWRYDIVVVASGVPSLEYTLNSSYRYYCGGSGCYYTGSSDAITILRYRTNEVLGTSTTGGQITFKPLPGDTLRFLFKGSDCNDNIRGTSFYGNRITISTPALSTPYKPIITVTGVTTSTSPVVFSWNSVPGAGSYCIRIYSDANLTNLVTSVCGLNQPTYTWNPNANARAEQTQVQSYYYQIAGENSVGQGEWSDAVRIDVQSTVTTIDATTNVESLSTIIPNPNQGNFTLVLNGVEQSEYKILDTAGKVVAAGTLTKGENNFNAGLEAGVYYVVTSQKVQKLVIY